MSSRPSLGTRGTLAAAGAVAATAAGIAASRSPFLRRQADLAVGFVRGGHQPPAAPVPPSDVPPGRLVVLPGRGEVFLRDSGEPAEVSGPAPVVLLLHGWTVSADVNFFAVYGALAGSYRVLAIDHRGHGRGMRSTETFTLEDCADDAAAVLDELGIPGERVIALGYSMGGPIATLLAKRHPGSVNGLVLQATALEWRASFADRSKWRLLSVFDVGLRVGSGEGVVERVLQRAAAVAPEVVPLRPWLEAEIQRGLGRTLIDAGRALSLFDSRPWARALKLPAVVCVTTGDSLVPPAKQRALAKALGAEVVEIDGDHDVTLVRGSVYARATLHAVAKVAEQLPAPVASAT